MASSSHLATSQIQLRQLSRCPNLAGCLTLFKLTLTTRRYATRLKTLVMHFFNYHTHPIRIVTVQREYCGLAMQIWSAMFENIRDG